MIDNNTLLIISFRILVYKLFILTNYERGCLSEFKYGIVF